VCEFACAHILCVSRYVCNPAVPVPLCPLPLSLSPSSAASQRLMDEANAEEQKVESALSIGSGSGRLSTVPTGERCPCAHERGSMWVWVWMCLRGVCI